MNNYESKRIYIVLVGVRRFCIHIEERDCKKRLQLKTNTPGEGEIQGGRKQ